MIRVFRNEVLKCFVKKVEEAYMQWESKLVDKDLIKQAKDALKSPSIDQKIAKKLQAIIELEGSAVSSVAKKYNINAWDLYDLLRDFKRDGIKSLEKEKGIKNKMKNLVDENLLLQAHDALELPGLDEEVVHRLKAIISVNENTISDVQKNFNVINSDLWKWVRDFKSSGVKGLERKKNKMKKLVDDNVVNFIQDALKLQNLDEAETRKLKAVIELKNHTIALVMKNYNVSYRTLQSWAKAIRRAEIDSQKRKNTRLSDKT